MSFISFRCTSCNQGLKIGADKAGRRIKCTKCGTPLTIPSPEQAQADRAAAAGPQLAADEPPTKKFEDEEDDDKKGYALLSAPQETEPKPEEKEKKDTKKAPPLTRKLKTLPDLDLWAKVRAGLLVMMVSVYVWAGAVLFMSLIVLLGMINGPEYAEVLEDAMTVPLDTPAGQVMTADIPKFMLGLVTGKNYQEIGKVFYILAAVLMLFQAVILMAGSGVCLKVPDRFGAKGQLYALLGIGGLNFILTLVFKLFPALGVMNYLMVPYALPEVSLVDANIDRDPAIWVLWSGAPFWEMTINVLFLCSFYAVPVFIGLFIWSVGLSLREDPVTENGKGIVILSLGIAFTLLAFHLLTMTGTSAVALQVMRVLYGLWLGFTILLLVRLPLALHSARAILQKYLEGAEFKDEDDEDEDEDDEDERPRRRRR